MTRFGTFAGVLAIGAILAASNALASDVVLWAAPGTQLATMIQKFQQENPDYTVKLVEAPWQVTHDKLVASMANGNPPDVALAADQWIGEFAHLGLLAPLDDFKSKQGYKDEDFYAGSWSHFVSAEDGKLYAAPAYTEARALFYRKDLFEAAGISAPPKTLDELVEDGKKLSNGTDHFGLADQSGDLDLHFFSWFLYSYGGDVYDADHAKCTLTGPKAVEALAFYKRLYDENIIPKDPAKRVATSQGFETGYYAMAESGAWWLSLIPREAPQIEGKWTAAPLPTGATTITYGHPNAWLVPAAAKNPDGAQAWIAFMLKPENALAWFDVYGQMPPVKSAKSDPRLSQNPVAIAILSAAEAGTNSIFNVPNGEAIAQEVIKMLSAVKDQGTDPAQAAADACGRIDTLLQG